jgi:adenine-specific DNA-methyltransferase
MSWRVECADALDFLVSLDAGSVQLVATDPPYFRVKDEPWDRQWDRPDQFLAWMDTIVAEVVRVLAPNGSLYLFASPRMSARVEVLIGERLNVLNRITWAKPAPHSEINKGAGNAGRISKASMRTYYPNTESIIFAEPFTASDLWNQAADGIHGSVFEPLRAYLDGERERAGVSVKALVGHMGVTTPSHYFSRSQWALPTAEHYESMRRALSSLNHGGEYLRREYEDLRREYEDLRREYEDLRREYEDLRRPFTVTADDQYTDVWTFPTVGHYPGKHPCEKPAPLMEQIIRASSRPGDLVVDPFTGSGATGVAAVRLGRDFAGCDMSEHWVAHASEKINAADRQPALF